MPTFEGHVEQILVPALHAGDVVVWDNKNASRVLCILTDCAQLNREPL